MNVTHTRRPPSRPLLCLALLAGLAAGKAFAQQPVPAQKNTVIKPPAHVDPGMQVKPPKSQAALPTPVIKPPSTVTPK